MPYVIISLEEARDIDSGELNGMTFQMWEKEFESSGLTVFEDCIQTSDGKFLNAPFFFVPFSTNVDGLAVPFLAPRADVKQWKVKLAVNGTFTKTSSNVTSTRQRISKLEKIPLEIEFDAEVCCKWGEWVLFFLEGKLSRIYPCSFSEVEGEIIRIPLSPTLIGAWNEQRKYLPRHQVRHKGHLWESKGFSGEPGVDLENWELVL